MIAPTLPLPPSAQETDSLAMAYANGFAGTLSSAPLALAVRDALAAPGGFSRGRLVLALMRAWGASRTSSYSAAVALEYWHTASLLLDDLPAMDDAERRRGAPCLHRVHGEGMTLLAALALINRAYALAHSATDALDAAGRADARELLEECLGAAGVLSGQAEDLDFPTRPRSAADVLRVAEGKTGSLFRIALEWPAALCGIAMPSSRSALRQLSMAWGRAYQIADDFKDCQVGGVDSGKTPGRDQAHGRPSLVAALGPKAAWRSWGAELRRAEAALDAGCFSSPARAVLAAVQKRFLGEWSAAGPAGKFAPDDPEPVPCL
jgi:geranylgeranyl pyrophosphate synthase